MSDVQIRLQDSVVSGIINGVINGIIAYFLFKNHPDVAVSLNSIAASEVSVWGQAVSLTFGLGVILTLITAKIFCNQMKKQHPAQSEQLSLPLFPTLFGIAINNAAALFGWFVVLAVIWTRIFGEVRVSTLLAAVLVGLFAMVVTLVVEVRTKKSIVFKKTSIFADNQSTMEQHND
ncbi:hypothetical protein [Shewanella sp. GXUN23E]|uniref:hypothetical protein n=1 Tax=Shewanella sp. GXUN23E TaxID=3422498 RepID=UPI003D7D16B7